MDTEEELIKWPFCALSIILHKVAFTGDLVKIKILTLLASEDSDAEAWVSAWLTSFQVSLRYSSFDHTLSSRHL